MVERQLVVISGITSGNATWKQLYGTDCWEYVLLDVDDVLVIGVEAKQILCKEIGRYFELREESIGPPDFYLGGKMREAELENGVKPWSINVSQYVQSAVNNVLSKNNQKQSSKVDTPMQTIYQPELYLTFELPPDMASYYQYLIGIFHWIVKLGQIDI
jgi:hypothetical protein